MGGRHELAADGDDGNARTARGGNLGHAAAGQKAHAGGVDDLAGAHDGLAGARFLARFAHVAAQLGRRLEGNAATGAAVAFHVAHDFVLHHGIGSRRQRRAGHDAHACALGDIALEGVAGGDFRDDVQLDGRFGACGLQLGSAHGEPVHGGMGERRDVDIAFQVNGSNAAGRIQHGDRFRRQLGNVR